MHVGWNNKFLKGVMDGGLVRDGGFRKPLVCVCDSLKADAGVRRRHGTVLCLSQTSAAVPVSKTFSVAALQKKKRKN